MASRVRRALVNFLDEVFEFIRDMLALILWAAAGVLFGLAMLLLVLVLLVLFLAIYAGVFLLLSLFLHPIAAALGTVVLALASSIVVLQRLGVD